MTYNPMSSNLALKTKKQIQKIVKISNHNKRNNYLNDNDSKINQISKISKNLLYLSDLITNLNPEELVQILSQNKQLSFQEVSPYKYLAQYQQKIFDFDYNEETDEIVQIEKDIPIQIMFEIRQINECQEQFTILFQNLSKQYDIEYQNLKTDLIQNIVSF
ncbi:hypothetical protein ABPG74_008702 [Tetrahymena malaccensis]